jgi:hypothetical protein
MVDLAPTGAVKQEFLMAKKTSKNPHAVALGKLGGAVGGPARARSLSKTERQKIARAGGRAKGKKG